MSQVTNLPARVVAYERAQRGMCQFCQGSRRCPVCNGTGAGDSAAGAGCDICGSTGECPYCFAGQESIITLILADRRRLEFGLTADEAFQFDEHAVWPIWLNDACIDQALRYRRFLPT